MGPAQDVAQLVAAAERMGVRTGVVVRDEEGGPPLFAARAGEAFAPASNLKLLTAIAVLEILGPAFEFRTGFELRDGRLLVRASGDPNASSETFFADAARALRDKGIRAIAGIVLDPGAFGPAGKPPTWPADQLDAWYCPPSGPFVLDLGDLTIRIEASSGPHAKVSLKSPALDVPLRGQISMSSRSKGAVYGAIDRGDSVLVRGRFWSRSLPVEIKVAMRDPEPWYRRALERALSREGIRIAAGARPPDGDVATVHGPLAPPLRRALRDSSNFDAEQLLRALGAASGDGSLEGSLEAERRALRRLVGNLPSEVVILDGSGLSAGNRVSPLFLVELIRAALRGRGGALLLDSLPAGGESGTLEDRFEAGIVGDRVRAKTGWIRGASALSGVLLRADGGRRVFSILMNYDPGRSGLNKDLKLLQERMVRAMDLLPKAR
ncbi:MAG: hypothetical protein Fur0037_13800 [Planctomycetota bacterium]